MWASLCSPSWLFSFRRLNSCSCLSSSRCLRHPPHTRTQPQRASFPLPYHSQLQLKLSACLKSLPLLVQISFGFVFVSDRFFFPPSIPSATYAAVHKVRRCHLCPSPSNYDGVLRQQAPRAPPTARTACLFVCLFVELCRSNFVVPARFRDLCALIENRVRSAGANIGHCPSQRKQPNVGTLS